MGERERRKRQKENLSDFYLPLFYIEEILRAKLTMLINVSP